MLARMSYTVNDLSWHHKPWQHHLSSLPHIGLWVLGDNPDLMCCNLFLYRIHMALRLKKANAFAYSALVSVAENLSPRSWLTLTVNMLSISWMPFDSSKCKLLVVWSIYESIHSLERGRWPIFPCAFFKARSKCSIHVAIVLLFHLLVNPSES